MYIAFFLYNVYNKRTKIRALKPTKEMFNMPDPENNNNIDPSDTKVATDDVKQRPPSVKPENDKSKTKISVTQESATEGRFETPVFIRNEKHALRFLPRGVYYI